MNQHQKHEFAVYWPELSECLKQYPLHALFKLEDKELVHRMVTVLRLGQEDTIILFDSRQHIHAELGNVSKKSCMIQINAIDLNKQLQPTITFGLPLLKKEAFETALYSLVECGVNAIQPLITQKVHRVAWSGKETERFERIVVAAAEQAKQFALPHLHQPSMLDDLNFSAYTHTIFFDPEGQSLPQFLSAARITKNAHLLVLIGPEGDLTPEEKELLKKKNVSLVALTPTILRAQQAAALGAGIFRALV